MYQTHETPILHSRKPRLKFDWIQAGKDMHRKLRSALAADLDNRGQEQNPITEP